MIESAEALEALSARVARAARVACDTEFHNERTYAAKLMVVQLVLEDAETGEADVALVDPLRVRDLTPLAEALGKTIVVGHALSSDLKIFADRYARLPGAAFDTQLAAAFCGYGISISLADLVRDVTGVRLKKSQTVSDWSTRPLTPEQLEYLVDDVRYLFPLQDHLREKLVSTHRLAWFEDEARALVDMTTYTPDAERLYLRIPGAMRMNRRELGVLREVALLRDRLARERDVPLKYVIPDDVMGGIASLRPTDVDALAQLRRLDAGVRKRFGADIVAAVAAGTALAEDDLPRKPARPAGVEREAIVSCLSVLASSVANEHDLPASLLATRSALERVARELPSTTEEVERALDGSAWRAALLAEPLRALIAGEVALTIAGAGRGQPRMTFVPTHAAQAT